MPQQWKLQFCFCFYKSFEGSTCCFFLERGNKASNPIRPEHETKKEVLQWFQTLMFPDGYAANLRSGMNLTTMRINGLKSHDYHIWIDWLLLVMVRGYLPDHVWQVQAELSYFFCILCAKELSRTLVAKLEDAALVLLCKLEKIYPPSLFNPMQDMILHLPYEARMGGLYMSIGAIQLKEITKGSSNDL
jgi:hypothetical protein